VTGKTLGGAKLQGDRNLLDRTEALRLYTTGGAWVSGEEGRKRHAGSRRFADLAILSADYFKVPEDRIKDIESLLTVVGGKVVYGAGPIRGSRHPFRRSRRTGCRCGNTASTTSAGLEDAQNLARGFSRPQLIADGAGVRLAAAGD